MLAVVPERAVVVGARWQETGTLVLPPLGSFTTEIAKTFSEIDRAEHVHITGSLTGRYSPPTAPADYFRVTGGDLKLEKGHWNCTFDRERGRALRVEKKLELRGHLRVVK